MKVTVLSKELIVPSSPTPSHLKTYKFSYLDQRIPPFCYPLILCYSYDKSTNITQSDMTNKLKTSLSETLTHFYPLAGRLSKDHNTVDCLDQGVPFLVTQVESSLSDFLKSPIINEESKKLVLVEPRFVEEQYAVQVNLFDCGGLALGLHISHRIGDACSSASILRYWFAIAKGSETPLKSPLFDSAVLFPPMDESDKCNPNQKHPTIHLARKNLVTKSFVFSYLTINKLKNEIVKDHRTMVKPPSKVEVVTALIWKSATMAFHHCKATVASHTVNLRRKIVPSLEDNRFGNLFQLAMAVAHQTEDLASLVEKLRVSFGKIDSDYLKALTGENRVEIATRSFEERQKYILQEDVMVFKFSSMCGLGFKEGDFGWGKPIWVRFSGSETNENGILLVGSVTGDGIEACVTMSHDNMKTFEQNAELQQFVG